MLCEGYFPSGVINPFGDGLFCFCDKQYLKTICHDFFQKPTFLRSKFFSPNPKENPNRVMSTFQQTSKKTDISPE